MKTNFKLVIGVLVVGVVCLVLGFMMAQSFAQSGYVPQLKITGDVKRELTVKKLSDIDFNKMTNYQNEKYKTVCLADLIAKTKPLTQSGDIYFMTADSFVASVAMADAKNCYLSFSDTNGWEVVNPLLPVSSNAKTIQTIIVAANVESNKNGIPMIDVDNKIIFLHPGRLAVSQPGEYLRHEGNAVVKHDGKNYTSNVYTKHKVFRLADIAESVDIKSFNIYGADGKFVRALPQDLLETAGNTLNLYQQGDLAVSDIQGIMVNPPARSITDAYFDVSHYLHSQRKVLLIIQDGGSYQEVAAAAKALGDNAKLTVHLQLASGVYPASVQTALNSIINNADASDSDLFSQAASGSSIIAKDWPVKSGEQFVAASAADNPEKVFAAAEKQLESGKQLTIVRLPYEKNYSMSDKLQLAEKLSDVMCNKYKGVVVYTGIPYENSGENGSIGFTQANMKMAYALISD